MCAIGFASARQFVNAQSKPVTYIRTLSTHSHERTNISNPIESITSFYGDSPRTSDWFLVEQSMIDKFGEATADSDWMHTDPERAKRDSPFGATIAFGFWTVSMMTYFGRQIMQRPYPGDALYGLNYGFDRVRLMSPVPVGSRIRCHMRLIDVQDKGDGRYLVKTEYTIEVENVDKPAMVAEWLFQLVFPVNDID